MRECVVALFPVGPYGPTTQGGHYRDPQLTDRTLCGREIVDKPTTVEHVKCSMCFQEAGGIVRPHKWPVTPAVP